MRRIVILAAVAIVVAALPGGARAADEAAWQAFLAANYSQALASFLPAAQAGDADAQYAIGVMYSQGKGVPEDLAEAVRWYRLAAERGHDKAAFNLGFLLFQGYADRAGNEHQDAAEALKWLAISGERGNAMAQALVGEMYLEGRGVPADPVTAFAWLHRAAEGGVPHAQFLAAQMMARGNGTTKDNAGAYRYLYRLAQAGYPGAAHNRDIVARRLSPEERAAIEAEPRS